MKPKRFIIVDDDELDIRLCKLHIKHTVQQMETVACTMPEEGLNYILKVYDDGVSVPSILLLDVNMPTMNAWEFLEKFYAFDQKIKDQITIYILSSSVDQRDQDKAAINKYVKGYLIKPITADVIKKLYAEYD